MSTIGLGSFRSELSDNTYTESEDRQVPKKYESHINQINNNDVALLKGTLWDSNYVNAVIHRSPVNHTKSRMVMTLDFV